MTTPEKFIKQFQNLRTDRNRHRWSALTSFQAPHKPFLLLSILDLIKQGTITSNFIEPSYELIDTFNGYWILVMPLGRRGLMSYPFYHMRSEPFWTLIPNPGQSDRPGQTFSSMAKTRQIYSGSQIDEELFQFMCETQTREQLRNILIEHYFASEIRSALMDQGKINFAAYKYSQSLVKAAEQRLPFEDGFKEELQPKVRDQGFRKAIVMLYNHRCALCGIRMMTPEGHTVVEAAHVKPWSESHDDQPTNGMSLCRLCHWSFDEGLMGVGRDYEVIVSERVRMDQNMPGHILTLSDRNIFTPEEEKFWPAQTNFAWHRENYFRT